MINSVLFLNLSVYLSLSTVPRYCATILETFEEGLFLGSFFFVVLLIWIVLWGGGEFCGGEVVVLGELAFNSRGIFNNLILC